QAIGEVDNPNLTDKVFTLAGKGSELTIHYTTPIIFLPGDFDTPSGTPADLVEDARVLVLGALNPDGTLVAPVIVLLAPPPDVNPGEVDAKVMIQHLFFDPMNGPIGEGETVRWTLRTNTAHAVASGRSPLDPKVGSGSDVELLQRGSFFDIKF